MKICDCLVISSNRNKINNKRYVYWPVRHVAIPQFQYLKDPHNIFHTKNEKVHNWYGNITVYYITHIIAHGEDRFCFYYTQNYTALHFFNTVSSSI